MDTEEKLELEKGIQLAIRKYCQYKDTSSTSLYTSYWFPLSVKYLLCEKHYDEYKDTWYVISALRELTR